MEVDRRSLMKGMLASGALLALGTPPWAFGESFPRRPSQCLLLLGGSGADDWFRSGAGAAATGMTYEGLQTVKLKGGLLTDTDRRGHVAEAVTRGKVDCRHGRCRCGDFS